LDILTRHRVPEQVYEDLIQLAETENEQSRHRLRSPLLPDIDILANSADPTSSVDDGRSNPPPDASQKREKPPLSGGFAMELGGLEPPTSWVRFMKRTQ